MNKNIEAWLKENPPRVELTEIEKNFKFDKNDVSKYVAYFDRVDGVNVYRVREYLPGERENLPNYIKDELDDYCMALCLNYDTFGFNVLGYSFYDLEDVRTKFNLFIQVF